jgi:hypothetical protein
VQLTPHDLVPSPSSRREGQIHSFNPAISTTPADVDIDASRSFFEQVLSNIAHDTYLGLKWYKSDPLPALLAACQADDNAKSFLFVDDEFPVHNNVHLEVVLPPKTSNDEAAAAAVQVVKCIPGVITSSNCRDFITVPKRIPRIAHFLQNANIDEGRWSWKRSSSLLQQHQQQHNKDHPNEKVQLAPTLFSSHPNPHQSIDPRNILQGKVGNCGFVSGIASLSANFPHILSQTFGTHSPLTLSSNSYIGAVSILLYPRGKPRYLLMDDYILCKNHNDDNTNDAYAARGRNPPSPSMHSLLPHDTWVHLLEKAFIKIQGSIASLDGYYKYNSLYRHPAKAIQLLTGAPIAMEVHYSCEDVDLLYNILERCQGRYVRVVHCRKRMEGLIPNHGYSLLWVGQDDGGGGEDGEDGKQKQHWVCLRNPHGQTSYKGYGCDGSLISCNGNSSLPSCLNVCQRTNRVVWRQNIHSECHAAFSLRDCNHDNGIFFMKFETFVKCFPITTLVGPVDSSVRDDVDEGSDVFGLDDSKECVYEVQRSNLGVLYDIIA